MQYVDRFHGFDFLPVASNDNDDLLAIDTPEKNLTFIRSLKYEMREENAHDGLLLRSRKKRKFFQEILDAEYYILLRYFSAQPDMELLQRLKRHILDHYLFPKMRPI
ncbi:MAG: hypothetical protein SFX19_04370 [Alphaproteobacteria bacterium]|nr:hypothetical protein [Alphaproteobacteria bacterium]